MQEIYVGKTKNVYKLEDGNLLLKFKDDMTGKDGKFDPGENQVGLSIDGMGITNLKVTTYLIGELKKHGIETHMISADIDEGTMVVKECKAFGKGVEVIFRNYAVGSFLRRYGMYVEEMQPLDNYVEFTLKDDKRQDPLITRDGLKAIGLINDDEYDFLVEKTKEISNILTDLLAEKNLQLIDIKLEFGKTNDGKIVLMDELSAGNMRILVDGKGLEPMEVSELIIA